MNIKSYKEKISLKLVLDEGIKNGKEVVRNKNISKIKTNVEDSSLYNVGHAISTLYENDLVGIKKVEESELIRE